MLSRTWVLLVSGMRVFVCVHVCVCVPVRVLLHLRVRSFILCAHIARLGREAIQNTSSSVSCNFVLYVCGSFVVKCLTTDQKVQVQAPPGTTISSTGEFSPLGAQ